jgi:hypothetical protein
MYGCKKIFVVPITHFLFISHSPMLPMHAMHAKQIYCHYQDKKISSKLVMVIIDYMGSRYSH